MTQEEMDALMYQQQIRMQLDLERVRAIAIEAKESAHAKARANLMRVVHAVGAQEVTREFAEGIGGMAPMYSLFVRDVTFLVDYRFIIVSRMAEAPHPYMKNLKAYRVQLLGQTCYQVQGEMPMQEKVAIALLRLRNSPDQFSYLMQHPGDWIGGRRNYNDRNPRYAACFLDPGAIARNVHPPAVVPAPAPVRPRVRIIDDPNEGIPF